MRYSPSTCSASFESACRLSRVRAFSVVFLARFCRRRCRHLLARPTAVSEGGGSMQLMTSCSEIRSYQTCIVGMPAKSTIASR